MASGHGACEGRRGVSAHSKTSRVPYDQLALLPYAVANAVCVREYTRREVPLVWGGGLCLSADQVAQVEGRRQKMTTADVREFEELTDARCCAAYSARAEWFEKCVKGGNPGRDQLHVWVEHWLASYLTNPELFRQSAQPGAVPRFANGGES